MVDLQAPKSILEAMHRWLWPCSAHVPSGKKHSAGLSRFCCFLSHGWKHSP